MLEQTEWRLTPDRFHPSLGWRTRLKTLLTILFLTSSLPVATGFRSLLALLVIHRSGVQSHGIERGVEY